MKPTVVNLLVKSHRTSAHYGVIRQISLRDRVPDIQQRDQEPAAGDSLSLGDLDRGRLRCVTLQIELDGSIEDFD